MEVKNKIVIVTGAGSGIGKAPAIHFASHGAKELFLILILIVQKK